MQTTGIDTKGIITNIQHFSVDDGPGIRTTVFLKGCPLHCAWCHNPETQEIRRELMYRDDKCQKCGACSAICPQGLHKICDMRHSFSRNDCVRCGLCSKVCLFGALETVGKEVTIDEVLSDLLLDKVFYEQSNGGVTLSGGEPLSQIEFTTALLAACKQHSIHTCVETCGYGKQDALLQVNKYTDIFLFDYKLTDDKLHKTYTGVSNRLILDNLDALCSNGADIILRCPMIPNVNITTSHFDGIVTLAQQYKNIHEIHLEPYHPLGISKSTFLGKTSSYNYDAFLDKKELEQSKDYIQEKVSIPVKVL